MERTGDPPVPVGDPPVPVGDRRPGRRPADRNGQTRRPACVAQRIAPHIALYARPCEADVRLRPFGFDFGFSQNMFRRNIRQ